MSEVTLKFANEEQYQSFINKVKKGVVEEMKSNGQVSYQRRANVWNYAKDKIQSLELTPHREYQLTGALSVMLRYGFNVGRADEIPNEYFDEAKEAIDNIFNEIENLKNLQMPENKWSRF